MAASRCTTGARSKRRRRHPFGGVAAVSFMAYVLCVMAYVLGVMRYAIRENHHHTTPYHHLVIASQRGVPRRLVAS